MPRSSTGRPPATRHRGAAVPVRRRTARAWRESQPPSARDRAAPGIVQRVLSEQHRDGRVAPTVRVPSMMTREPGDSHIRFQVSAPSANPIMVRTTSPPVKYATDPNRLPRGGRHRKPSIDLLPQGFGGFEQRTPPVVGERHDVVRVAEEAHQAAVGTAQEAIPPPRLPPRCPGAQRTSRTPVP